MSKKLVSFLMLCLAAACMVQPPLDLPPKKDVPAVRTRSIVACGQRIPIDAPVVLWTDPGGYDATSTQPRFGRPRADGPAAGSLRYAPGRAERGEGGRVLIEPGSPDLERLRSTIDLFVVHYDACGTSRRCFEVLHDLRGLSVHFLLDLDGTIYQTMDLRDQAWHAREANPRSIGIEIANIGAFPTGEPSLLDDWYVVEREGVRIRLPASESGALPAGFVGRPRRDERVAGRIQGQELEMYDLTPEQQDSLARLTAALCELFPRIRPDAPRDEAGRVRAAVLEPEEVARFHGIVGHYHLTRDKLDPGPAFDWEAYLARVRARLAARG